MNLTLPGLSRVSVQLRKVSVQLREVVTWVAGWVAGRVGLVLNLMIAQLRLSRSITFYLGSLFFRNI